MFPAWFCHFLPHIKLKLKAASSEERNKRTRRFVRVARKMNSGAWVIAKTERWMLLLFFLWVMNKKCRSKDQRGQKRNELHAKAEGKDLRNICWGSQMKNLLLWKKINKYSNRYRRAACAVWVVEIITLHSAIGSVEFCAKLFWTASR